MMRLALTGLVLTGILCAGSPVETQAQWRDVIRNLRHPNAATRLDAVNRLADVAYRSAAEPVAALITDPDDRVQAAAIEAQLRFFQSDRIGGTRLLGLGSSRSPAQEAFEAGPLLRGPAPVPPVVLDQLLLAVRDDHARVRFDAIHAFGFLAEPPLTDELTAKLAAELDHYDPIVRAATARVIGRLRATGASGALVTGLGDSNAVVRQFATESIGLIGVRASAPGLREQLGRVRGDMIGVTTLALARLGEAGDLGLFRERLTHRDAVIRRAAVEGLGRIGDRESMPYIEALLQNDRSAAVRTAAAFALHLMGQQQSHVIAPMLVVREVNAQARDYLFEIGWPAVPGVISTLRVATDGRHRADLVQLVGYLGTRDDIPVIEPLAGDPDERVRRAVASAIARLQR